MAERHHQRPTEAQIRAADPDVSAWVGANAGSGKTRVLAQRVARLLLAGSEPERILCLTYTKAAAAEMQNRLFDTLGDWTMASDAWLGQQLAFISGRERPVDDAGTLARARRLFAKALETPGGLKIQTIHAFCDALLRRFPLEAGVSPRFEVIDERQSALMIAGIRTDLAAEAEAGGADGFDRIARRLNESGIDDLIAAILAGRKSFPGDALEERLQAHFRDVSERTADETAEICLSEIDWDEIADLASWLREGGKGDAARAAQIDAAIACREGPPPKTLQTLASAFTRDGAPRSRKGFPTKQVLTAHPQADDLTDRMVDWSLRALAALNAAEAASRARDLDLFATALLTRYRDAKAARALLDFDDLVARASDLLCRSDMAAWALYRLDQGIDHILVDEAQDTSPGQWTVIRALAEEFHAGAGARGENRTLFVVGDEKQSIYSFQGAEPAAFGENRQQIADWLAGMDMPLAQPDLITSFRSAPGILAFVDKVFMGKEGTGLRTADGPIEHNAHREDDASRIDLWPLVESDGKIDPADWWTPVDQPSPGHAKQRLARMLADEIARMVREDRLPAREGKPGRRVRPGDILILVQHRDALAEALIRNLKTHRLAVAGADRLTLAKEIAVQDLMALIKVAVTPGDDLSLAALLRSPLCGVSEERLFELAHGRERVPLWNRVTAEASLVPEAAAMLRDMASQADFLRPYEFLERVLIRHDGRRRLLARLGHEAEDPIDELLVQALVYEAREAPTLAGFVAWIEAGDVKVKREMEQGAGEIRVMTVHGAKGLEAPVVILPDTLYQGSRSGPTLLPAEGGENAPELMLWARAKPLDDEVTERARAEADRRESEERRRLLYVALTRAEDWLILCGAGSKPDRWYAAMEAGMEMMGGVIEVPGPPGLGMIRRIEHQPVPVTGPPMDEAEPEAAMMPERPDWLVPAPREARPRRVSPSTLFPHEEAGGAGLGRELALVRGEAIHLLLERLPEVADANQEGLARHLLAQAFPGLDHAVAEAAIAEVAVVMSAPFADRIFGPDSLAEVSVSLALPQISPDLRLGRIDRLVVTPDRVLVVDFKTDARPSDRAEDVPPAYLAQLGCYARALEQIYPQRIVETAILWTAVPNLMLIPAELLGTALAPAAMRAP